jgi:hypothetical protein
MKPTFWEKMGDQLGSSLIQQGVGLGFQALEKQMPWERAAAARAERADIMAQSKLAVAAQKEALRKAAEQKLAQKEEIDERVAAGKAMRAELGDFPSLPPLTDSVDLLQEPGEPGLSEAVSLEYGESWKKPRTKEGRRLRKQALADKRYSKLIDSLQGDVSLAPTEEELLGEDKEADALLKEAQAQSPLLSSPQTSVYDPEPGKVSVPIRDAPKAVAPKPTPIERPTQETPVEKPIKEMSVEELIAREYKDKPLEEIAPDYVSVATTPEGKKFEQMMLRAAKGQARAELIADQEKAELARKTFVAERSEKAMKAFHDVMKGLKAMYPNTKKGLALFRKHYGIDMTKLTTALQENDFNAAYAIISKIRSAKAKHASNYWRRKNNNKKLSKSTRQWLALMRKENPGAYAKLVAEADREVVYDDGGKAIGTRLSDQKGGDKFAKFENFVAQNPGWVTDKISDPGNQKDYGSLKNAWDGRTGIIRETYFQKTALANARALHVDMQAIDKHKNALALAQDKFEKDKSLANHKSLLKKQRAAEAALAKLDYQDRQHVLNTQLAEREHDNRVSIVNLKSQAKLRHTQYKAILKQARDSAARYTAQGGRIMRVPPTKPVTLPGPEAAAPTTPTTSAAPTTPTKNNKARYNQGLAKVLAKVEKQFNADPVMQKQYKTLKAVKDKATKRFENNWKSKHGSLPK